MNADAGAEHRGERRGLLVAVVDAGQHQILDEDLAAAGAVPGAAGLEHLDQRIALVDRHQLRAQGILGGVQGEGEADRWAIDRHPLDPRHPADGRDGRV